MTWQHNRTRRCSTRSCGGRGPARRPLSDAVVAAVLLPRLARRHDSGMFGSKEAALAANALYRYWNMVGVKDAHQESLVGQAGEIEPVYERYAVTFFILAGGKLHFPQIAEAGAPRRPSRSNDRAGTFRWWSPRTDHRSG